MPAFLLLLALWLAAAVLGAAGVYMLAGTAWVLVFLAGACVTFAVVLTRGLNDG